MRRVVPALAALVAVALVVVPSLGAQTTAPPNTTAFLDSFDGTPAQPLNWQNPLNWDLMVFGVNSREPNLAQHGPNCEAPGFPYNPGNTHPFSTADQAVFQCNSHIMTSPGITGYGAVYMTPPAVADFSRGPARIAFDMSTLRTSSRDWVYVTITPFLEHHEMPYLNTDQHQPPHNIRILLGGANTFILYQRVNGQDIALNQQDSFHTWDDVFRNASPPTAESATRRDTFETTLSSTSISFCMPNYTGFNGEQPFCWGRNVALAQVLDDATWHRQASVQITHVVYNAEKSCETEALQNGYTAGKQPGDPLGVLDQYDIVHNAYGDANCPPNTWHWDNMSISPAVPYSVITSQPANLALQSPSATTVNFAQSAPDGSYLSFVSWGDTPQLSVSFNGGATWQAPHFQEATSLAHPEVGENVFMPIPTGQRTVTVRGAKGYWGTFEAQAFKIVVPPGGAIISQPTPPPVVVLPTPAPPTAVLPPTAAPTAPVPPTVAPTAIPTDTPTAVPPTPTVAATATPAPPVDKPTPEPTATPGPAGPPICAVVVTQGDGTLLAELVPCSP